MRVFSGGFAGFCRDRRVFFADMEGHELATDFVRVEKSDAADGWFAVNPCYLVQEFDFCLPFHLLG